ncbi:sialate O-acetylesterase [Mycoplasmatota bacterium]|nr:sialate O-acetylesterase [Mycoplasmatota bacterium]
MIAPLKQYSFRGVVWYQGEGQHVAYEENMTKLIDGWRRVFNHEDLKFVIVELPRIDFDLQYTESSWFKVREQQKRLADYPNVTYSVNIDLGIKTSETNDPMHPYDKKEAGKRAAHAFMKSFYQAEGVLTSPKITYIGYDNNDLILKFSNVGEGLYLNDYLAGFEVSVDGVNYQYAKPILIDQYTIRIETDERQVLSVRYGYSYSITEVFGLEGTAPTLADLVCVYNSGGYPLDQFEIYL